MLLALSKNFAAVGHHQSAVNAGEAARGTQFLLGLVPDLKELLRGDGTELFQGFATGILHGFLPEGVVLFRRCRRQDLADTAAGTHYGLVEQTFTQGTHAVLLHAHAACALAHDGHVVRIAAKSGDVVMHPLNGTQLVEQAVVAGEASLFLELGQTHETHRAEAIVQRNTDHAFGRPYRAVEVLFVSAAAGEATAVDIDEYRQFVAFLGGIGGEDVQEQTVLAVGVNITLAELIVIEDLFQVLFLVVERAWLVGAGTVLSGIIYAIPVGDLNGIFPASGGGVADTLVGCRAGYPSCNALNSAAGGIDDVVHTFIPFVEAVRSE